MTVAKSDPIKLTEWTSCGGCAAKWGASLLEQLVNGLELPVDPSLLVGLAPFDDAAVYKVSDDVAIVSTTDFFPPLVDDPDDFGAIAAANACSDVFAMGGRVIMAVNIAAFPENFPVDAISAIFASAGRVVTSAGGSLAGGHTIRNPEPVFGLAVQGVVNPKNIFRKGGAVAGDIVLLSKPIGTGLVLLGGSESDKQLAIIGMRQLNRQASEQLQALGSQVHAVTDVTGYGLAGHGWEMAQRSGRQLVLFADKIPTYSGALQVARRGELTGGEKRNREYVSGHFTFDSSTTNEEYVALCMDPQTSGGLLAAVSPDVVSELLRNDFWSEIGEITSDQAGVHLR